MSDPGSKNIYLVAGFNRAYLGKAEAYLESMNENSNVNNVIVTLDFEIDATTAGKYNRIRFQKISSSQVRSPNSNTCMQHGAFLEALDFVKADDIVIFTDTDIQIQRPFSEAELALLSACKDQDVLVNFNGPEERVLLDEAQQLNPQVTPDELVSLYPEFAGFKSYNTGVLAANRRTYNAVYDKYNEHWQDFSPLIDSYVKQQLLLSYIVQKYFNVVILPYTVHSHGNSVSVCAYSCAERIGFIGEGAHTGFKLCIGSEVLVFNHHIRHEKDLKIAHLQRRIRTLGRTLVILAAALLAVTAVLLVN